MALPKTSKEAAALEQFETLVTDLDVDRGTVMRFLRARNLNLENAETMLRAHVHWKNNNVYEPALIGWKPPKAMLLKFEVYLAGNDPEGRPVFFINFPNWLPSRPLFDEYSPFDMLVFAYKTFAIIFEDILKTQHQQVVAIVDAEGIGFTKILQEVQFWTGVQTLIDVWQIYEKNFPETLHKVFMLNAARAFLWGYSLVKPFATKQTLSKVSIFGTDSTQWRPVLHSQLPQDCIPEQFGGCANMKSVYDIAYDGILQRISIVNDEK